MNSKAELFYQLAKIYSDEPSKSTSDMLGIEKSDLPELFRFNRKVKKLRIRGRLYWMSNMNRDLNKKRERLMNRFVKDSEDIIEFLEC